MNKIYLTESSARGKIGSRIDRLVATSHPRVLGVATAFLSTGGARSYDALVRDRAIESSRVVAGLSGSITHPHAISYLINKGHRVRLGQFTGGIFHPKLLVGGNGFSKSGEIVAASCGYIGSANFTDAGLNRNLEVMLATKDRQIAVRIAEAFRAIWAAAIPVTKKRLSDYEQAFARAQRSRSLADLAFLDVVDKGPITVSRSPVVAPRLSSAVWAGLQSFTGEHTFQVEFPRKAGEALNTLLGTRSGEAQVECSDGRVRRMGFRYYADNSMYRLNVPNDTPLVDWARANHMGALLVWRDDDEPELLKAEIIRGRQLYECVTRSRMLGTWGRTTTRQYGWY
jgi:hypothetical protein